MDFVHCNQCFICPSKDTHRKVVFFISSCGHLFCHKCIKPAVDVSCRICQKRCTYLEVNRTLKPELQIFFRNPSELAAQYLKNMKSVMDFQKYQRERLQKYRDVKANKVMQYAESSQSEVSKRVQGERSALNERNQMKMLLKKQLEHSKSLEVQLQKRNTEIQELRRRLSDNGTTGSFINHSSSSITNDRDDIYDNRDFESPHQRLLQRFSGNVTAGSLIDHSSTSITGNGNSASTSTEFIYQPDVKSLKPSVLASYSASRSLISNNSTSTINSAKSALMAGRIKKGRIIPRTVLR
ncbi:zinc-RING finger domain-containing protein [Ditylenchus destructor]|nr:zinc-RING finger domain-containing protein [Ditylenchus destructor]